jgi:diguanylate cyclase (GGDEF)-like protein
VLKSHERFYSANGKRLVLVVDDESINREILGNILETDYEVIYAADGNEAQQLIQEHQDVLSLVLLDMLIPSISGSEILKWMKQEPGIQQIPVIVISADQSTEIESLGLGAIDFIPKPFPPAGVIQARILRTIELSEDRQIITSTERDPLTGLYNREFFFRYAEQYDHHHKGVDMDAIVVDVNNFHMINERFGTAYGDRILRNIGSRLREIVKDSDGIVCRREADTFMVYCPHGKNYKDFLDAASEGLSEDSTLNNRIRLRMGVYAVVDKTLDIERRFDRAKSAADTVSNSFAKIIGIYDDTLHDQQIYAEQLIEAFPKAVEEKQFIVYYQPKFDIQAERPILTSAEALVRWQHPQLGLISPSVFIPLFENNGLIKALDTYVWREVAAQLRDWKDRLGYSVPVSVNVSRIDLFDPDLVDIFQELLEENRLSPSDMHLEVTESAYTQDSRQLIETVEHLRGLGFKIEMDDFGTGYSSLNMISTMPIDALKLDMEFVRNAFKEGQNTRMLELIIDIAEHLSVVTIAEGVETSEQLKVLREMGCDIVQGFYFSKPISAVEYEAFLLARKKQFRANIRSTYDKALKKANNKKKHHRAIYLRMANVFFILVAFIAAIALFVTDGLVNHGYHQMEKASQRYIDAQLAATDMELGSEYLTDRARCFVVTGDIQYMNDFFEEVEVTRRRDTALSNLKQLLDGQDSIAYDSLSSAMEQSNTLVAREYQAMRLVMAANNIDLSQAPTAVQKIKLRKAELALPAEKQKEKALELLFDNDYLDYKDQIRENTGKCTQALIAATSDQLAQSSKRMSVLLAIETVMTVILLMIVLCLVVFISEQVRKPLTRMVELMRSQQPVPPTGAAELRFVAETYNDVSEENRKTHEQLAHAASHDALTGLYNRGAYEMLMRSVDEEHIALLLIDVDRFKMVNDTYGHDIGDRVLKRVADVLKNSFRSVDLVCRIGGDEFVVIMTRINHEMRELVSNKIDHANEELRQSKDGLPPISLSVGVAFSDSANPQGDIYKDADTALYQVKASGRSGCHFY